MWHPAFYGAGNFTAQTIQRIFGRRLGVGRDAIHHDVARAAVRFSRSKSSGQRYGIAQLEMAHRQDASTTVRYTQGKRSSSKDC